MRMSWNSEAADLEAALEQARARGTVRQFPTLERALVALAPVVRPETARAQILEPVPDAPTLPVIFAYVSPTRFLKVGAWHAMAVRSGSKALGILVVLEETAVLALVRALLE